MKTKRTSFRRFLLIAIIFLSFWHQRSAAQGWDDLFETDIIVGAERPDLYIPLLVGKNVALVMNQTSTVGDQLLVDTLIRRRIKVRKIFTPEHGLRGTADAGQSISSGRDEKTNLPLISLYGNQKKPGPEQLADVDVVVFDLQDVGARFYTYISTMHYVMQACAENNKHVIILDRPNPNGHYVDGPVLEMTHRSFVGMHPIPIVHGMTIGELAKMINEEGWLSDDIYTKTRCKLDVIPCQNYDHSKKYSLPVNPSPNLPNDLAINLYPSLCLFEGTDVSIGRGTNFPFQVYGHPDFKEMSFAFTPKSMPGKASSPKHMNETCYGKNLNYIEDQKFTLQYLLEAYKMFEKKEEFFNPFFRKLVGNDEVQKMIEQGKSETEIRKSWEKDVADFKQLRRKYLLYQDFE